MKRFLKDVKNNKVLLAMTLPAVIYIIMFSYIPMFGIIIAFKDYNYRSGIFGSKWVGLKNFEFLFKSGDLYVILRNTIGYNIVFILLGIALAVALAVLYDALGKSRLIKLNQTLSILPHFLSIVVIGYFVNSFINTDKGLINQFLTSIGKEQVNWYSEPKYWPYILTFVKMWMTVGWNSVIYFSTIKGFNSDYFEAACVDGATWWQRIRHITLPLLKPTIIVLLIMSIGGIMSSGIDLFYIIPRNSGALYSVTSTVDTYVYNGLLKSSNMGMTSATSVFQSVVGFILVVITNAVVRRVSPEDSMF